MAMNMLRVGAEEERGETARLSSFVGAIAVGDLVKTTLGPKGMDKILVAGGEGRDSVTVTNDGATILKSIGVDNPASKLLVDMSMTQDNEVGDGTTSVTVLAAELLREAEKLIDQKLHPQTIIAGYRIATQTALDTLEKAATPSANDKESLRIELMKIAKTTLCSKILGQHSDHFATLAVDAVIRLKGSGDLDAIQVIKKLGGSMLDSYLDDGFILEKKPGMNQPQRVENARILIANTPMDTDKVKVFGTRVRVDGVAKVAELEAAENEKMADKVKKIVAHNINVFINRQLIYNYPEQLFADANIMAIEHADFEGIDRLAKVLGGDVVSTFDTPDKVKLGSCDLIEPIFIGEDRVLKFSGVPLGEACTIVLRGATQQILDEAERSLHDALCVLTTHLKESLSLPGGGAAEMAASVACRKAASKQAGKQSLAIDAYARALAQLPSILADNAGIDSAELVSQLRAKHDKAQNSNVKCNFGLDVNTGVVADMIELGVIESYRVKRSMVASASEAAEMILRVDDVIKSAPRPRGKDRRPC